MQNPETSRLEEYEKAKAIVVGGLAMKNILIERAKAAIELMGFLIAFPETIAA